jgi:Uma2 family endonuclease
VSATRQHPDSPDDVPPSPVGPMSFESFLRFSEQAEWRYEFVDGYAYAMHDGPRGQAGGTRGHHVIAMNVAARVWQLTRGTSCETYGQAFVLRTSSGNTYCPDVMVVCGPTPPDEVLYVEHACLVVEVLSPSTARTDQHEKRIAYQEIASLQAYLLIEATWRAVHRHWRDANGNWRSDTITGAADTRVPLPCPVGASLSLDEIYERVGAPVEPPRAWRVYEQAQAADA